MIVDEIRRGRASQRVPQEFVYFFPVLMKLGGCGGRDADACLVSFSATLTGEKIVYYLAEVNMLITNCMMVTILDNCSVTCTCHNEERVDGERYRETTSHSQSPHDATLGESPEC